PGYVSQVEHRIIRRDGEIRHIVVRFGILKDENGRTIKTHGANQDITERKRAEEALVESKEFLNKIINSISDPIHVKDRQHRVLLINDAACRLFNLSREEIIGKTAYDLFPRKEMADISWQKDEEVFSIGKGSINEEINTYAPGKTLAVLVKKTLYTNTAGNQFLVGITSDITERKRAEEALKESEERLNLAIEGANLGLWDLDIVTNDVIHNRRWTEMLGFSIDEMEKPSDWWGKRVHPDDYPLVEKSSLDHYSGKVPLFDAIYRMKHKDGSWIWVHSQGKVVLRDTDDRPLRMIGINQDVTEHKRAEETERQRTEFQKGVITNARVWMSVLDQRGNILLWNPAAEEISGYRADEVIGKNEIWKLLYPQKEYRKRITDTINRIIHDQKYLENFETTIRSKQGNEKVISWNTKGIPDATGRISDYIAIGVDVTDRHLAEQMLRESEERLNLALDGANLGLWDMNLLTGEMTHNRHWAEMLGFSMDEMEKPSVWWGERVHPDDYQNVLNCSNLHRTGKVPLFDAVYRMRHKDGSWRWVHSQGKVVARDSEGQPLRMIGINQDITDRKRAEEALHKANKQLNLLSDITRHDILNQLLVLRGYLELSHDVIDKPEALKEYIKKEQKAAKTIDEQITFTRDYQNLGVSASAWQNVNASIRNAMVALPMRAVHIEPDPADP
ncbi:MAG: PAS domain S-box protein, partial [Methanoregula sp.]|nr:PAS domain S-box protein [Methanoregula sp.]